MRMSYVPHQCDREWTVTTRTAIPDLLELVTVSIDLVCPLCGCCQKDTTETHSRRLVAAWMVHLDWNQALINVPLVRMEDGTVIDPTERDMFAGLLANRVCEECGIVFGIPHREKKALVDDLRKRLELAVNAKRR